MTAHCPTCRCGLSREADRLVEAFRLLQIGLTSAQIAQRLGVSPRTVQRYAVRHRAITTRNQPTGAIGAQQETQG